MREAVAPAIEVRDLKRSFGDVIALDGLDLHVDAGTVLGLLGPNGAGKTTLVRVLATLLSPDGGSAEVLGHDVVAEPLAVRRRIGLAGQFAAVDEELTGRENLEMIGELHHLGRRPARERAGVLLEQFSLVDAATGFIAETEPWKLAKDEANARRVAQILYEVAESLRIAAILLLPAMPASAAEILRRVGAPKPGADHQLDDAAWNGAGELTTTKADAMWPRIGEGKKK